MAVKLLLTRAEELYKLKNSENMDPFLMVIVPATRFGRTSAKYI